MFFRFRDSSAFSIEKVFSSAIDHLPKNVSVTRIEMPHRGARPLTVAKNLLYTGRHRGQVNHVTGDIHYVVLALPRRRTILTICDLVSLERSRGIKRWALRLFWYQLPMWWVREVTAISEFTRDSLVREFPRFRRRISVIECSLSDIFLHEPPSPAQGDGTVLIVGTSPNKNVASVVEACAPLGTRLIVVGNLDAPTTQVVAESGLEVENISAATEESLLAAYKRSTLLAFPSRYEGFGMPIIEAQSVGIPVITSNRSPMSDVAGGAALLVDPESVSEIRNAIATVISKPSIAAELRESGIINSRRFRPEFAAAKYASLYEEVSGSN